MKNVLRILAISALFSACTSVPLKSGIPPTTGATRIVLGNVKALYDEAEKVKIGAENVTKVVATECFKVQTLGAKFTETNNLTNQQIYDLVSTAQVTIDVEMYMGSWYANHISKTVGYEDEPGKVYMNRYFVYTSYNMGSTLLHEAMGHSLGFTHNGVKSTSVPYKFNDFFDLCAKEAGVK